MTAPAMRLDKWLWQARFFKSRSRAGRLCREGRVRVAGAIVVVFSCAAGISPNPLKRLTSTFAFSLNASLRSASRWASSRA